MNKNAWNLILLLTIAVFAAKCTASQPLSDNNQSEIRTNDSSSATSAATAIQQLRKDIVNFAKKYEGSTYKYGGTTPKGFDCSGFTLFVLNEFDIKLPHNSGAQSLEGKKIKIEAAQMGDLLFFENKGKVNHVGLVVANDTDGLWMIHSSSRGVVIDNVYQNSYWKPRLKSARTVLK